MVVIIHKRYVPQGKPKGDARRSRRKAWMNKNFKLFRRRLNIMARNKNQCTIGMSCAWSIQCVVNLDRRHTVLCSVTTSAERADRMGRLSVCVNRSKGRCPNGHNQLDRRVRNKEEFMGELGEYFDPSQLWSLSSPQAG